MPRIFDNIEQLLLPALTQTLTVSYRADFCVGYFNLRGWKELDQYVERWPGGEGRCCRLLVGMHRTPQEELRQAFTLSGVDTGIDNPEAVRLKRKLAGEFRHQLMLGAPTNEDEAGLRRLARQLREKKLVVKLHLRHPLHAKLYLLFRNDFNNPISGYLGSSNLTLSGLSYQGELNVDVLDHDACQKLGRWFDDRGGLGDPEGLEGRGAMGRRTRSWISSSTMTSSIGWGRNRGKSKHRLNDSLAYARSDLRELN